MPNERDGTKTLGRTLCAKRGVITLTSLNHSSLAIVLQYIGITREQVFEAIWRYLFDGGEGMKELLTRKELMELLGISRATLIRMERRGDLKSIRILPRMIVYSFKESYLL